MKFSQFCESTRDSSIIMCVVINLLILMLMSLEVRCDLSEIEDASKRLDEILDGIEVQRYSRNSERNNDMWQEYEFGTGVDNREEVLVTNITVQIDSTLKNSIFNYQHIEVDGNNFLAGSSDYIFSFYKIDLTQDLVVFANELKSDRKILTFKLLSLPNASKLKNEIETIIIAILCVESESGSNLYWYRFNGKNLVYSSGWEWPMPKGVQRLEFFHRDNQNRLLILRDEISSTGQILSTIDIYGFDISGEGRNFWITQGMTESKIFDLQICETYESFMMILQRHDDVAIYEYRSEKNNEISFKKHQNVTSNGLKNVICFESGYIRYLVTSGPNPKLFDFFENEFQHENDFKDVFDDIGEVLWIENLPIDTYREESILLVQLKNTTIVMLSWNGHGYEKIPLHDIGSVDFDLSKITIIPKYGFVYGKLLVKIHTELREKSRPARDEVEKMMQTKEILEEVLRKQELILNKTEILINESYFVNPNVTGFWNLTNVEVDSLIIEDVKIGEVEIGKKKLEIGEYLADLSGTDKILTDLEKKFIEIRKNLNKSVSVNATEVNLNGDLTIDGGFDIGNFMIVKNLTFEIFNGFSLKEMEKDFFNYDEKFIIEGQKIFESIDADYFNVETINGVPISDVVFDTEKRDYSKIDFSKLTKLKIEGNLNFSNINGIGWEGLMKKIVRKSGTATIPGVTIINGDLIADDINIDRLNDLRYPEDYIMSNSGRTVIMSGEKEFDKLSVGNLDIDRLRTINDLPIEEYVTLQGDRNLTEEITFESLSVTEKLTVDGNVTGLSESEMGAGKTMEETRTITTNVVFANLKVIGDIEIENSLDGTSWSELDDIITKDEKFVEITGQKTFLGDVEVASELSIKNQMINNHSIDEFVTLDTDQIFPNLEKITGNVTFDRVTRGDLEELKKYLSKDLDEDGEQECLTKLVIFGVPPIVEKLFLGTVNENISAEEFSDGLNKTFSNVHFQNLEVLTLRSREILPIFVNEKNFTELKNTRITKNKSQTLIGNYEIGMLETNLLKIGTIDGMIVEQLENLRIHLNDLYEKIGNGNEEIESLTVTGQINVSTINGESIEKIFKPDTMGTVIFHKDVFIKDLRVDGLMNGINFTDYADDAILKTDRNIVITGNKTFGRIICQVLEASNLNGRSVDYILDSHKHQILSGKIKIDGTVIVTDHFETLGEIGGISWHDIQKRFQYLGNDTYAVNGDVRFTSEEVTINDLVVTESIQGVVFNDFLRSVIYKNSKNITIDGPIVFENAVTINAPFTITESFNDLDLKYFYDHAVRIDRPFSVKSKVVFTDDIVIEEDLLVDDELKAKAVGGVDLEELYENSLFVDRPINIPGTTILDNVIFESDINVETLNGLDMSKVITLKSEQTIDGTLHCMDITVGNLDMDIYGTFNGQSLGGIIDDTFMLTGHQNISGEISFRGNVHINNNFDARLINNVDPTAMINLDGNDTLIGNFIFEKPIILHGKYESSDTINDIDLMKWQATVITTSFPFRQIIKGPWTIHGNLHFHDNIDGNDFLDDVNVTGLVNYLHKDNIETQLAVKDLQDDMQSFCEDLNILKRVAEHQIYKYKYFEYLQVLNFDRKIVSVHQFEFEDFDYLLINYDTCHLDIFVFTGTQFTAVTSVSNVGYVERWFTMYFEGEMYFLTIGQNACNRNRGNLWKLANDQFVHAEDLGNITDAKKLSDEEFLLIVDNHLVRRSILQIYQRSLSPPKSYNIGSDDVKFVRDSSELLLLDEDSIYEYNLINDTGRQMTNCFGTNEISSFRLGIYQREVFVYHNERLSEEYLFISDNNVEHHKILQTIEAKRPSSITVINFDGFVENFLIFIESGLSLEIYEYRGIEGFVYRETIKMNVEKIFKLKLRKYAKLAKKNCIAAIEGNKLVILEAKMYGERLDMDPLSCKN